MARRSTIVEVGQEINKGTSYQADIGLMDVNDDLVQIPSVVEESFNPLTHAQLKESIPVFYDLETNGLGVKPDIMQIASSYGERTFNRYILPKGPIMSDVEDITKLSRIGNTLFHKDNAVFTVNFETALRDFIDFLPNNAVLVGHNSHTFDNRILLLNLIDFGKIANINEKVVGFFDTLPLCKDLYKTKVPNFKQETLVKNIANISYETHNALADCQALQMLFEVSSPSIDKLSTYTVSLQDETERIKRLLKSDSNYKTLKLLVDSHVMSKSMARRTAASGLRLEHLQLAFKHGGKKGIREVLEEPKANGKPRVTNSKRILESVSSFLLEQAAPGDSN